jgi:uncharacterized protein YjbI with pentapeptide repeats
MNSNGAGRNRVTVGRTGGGLQPMRSSNVRRWASILMVVLVPTMAGVAVTTAAPAAASTREAKPGPPTDVTVTPVSGGEMVSWTPPAKDGGSPITGYTASGLTGVTCSTTGATACTLSGFVDGQRYIIHVRAMNAVGLGRQSAGVKVTAGQSPDCSTIGPGADLQYCPLQHADLANADLPNANLRGADLVHADLSGATVTGANLEETKLGGVKLAGLDLTGVASGGIFNGPKSLPPNWQLVGGYLLGPGADLDTVNFSLGVDWTGVDLSNADLTNAGIGVSRLTNVNFTDASMSNVAFANSSLVNVDFTGANLTHADLNGTTIVGATLLGVPLADANLSELSASGITGAPASLPTNWRLVDGYLLGPGGGLQGADLAGVNLSGADLDEESFIDDNLTGADLSDTQLISSGFYEADLTDANLNGANMTSAANLDQATWNNTTCPDGTNSNDDGNTCISNLG